jgi:hypothetical protein
MYEPTLSAALSGCSVALMMREAVAAHLRYMLWHGFEAQTTQMLRSSLQAAIKQCLLDAWRDPEAAPLRSPP